MPLLIVVIKGPREGDRFKVRAGLHIGRSKAEINLRDPKASSKHAIIQETEGGRLMLVDLGSTNGIRLGSQKVGEVELKPGLQFVIGATTLEVQGEEKLNPDDDQLEEWRKILLRVVTRASANAPSEGSRIAPFNIPVEIELRSPYRTEKVLFSYGPRKVGAACLDLTLDGLEVPKTCFELQPEGDVSVRYKTDHPDVVLLNGNRVETDILNDGDIITVQDTQMRIRFRA